MIDEPTDDQMRADAAAAGFELFDTVEELAANVAERKAALRRAALEFCAECGVRVSGPRDLAALDAKLAPGYALLDRHAAIAEQEMRRFNGVADS